MNLTTATSIRFAGSIGMDIGFEFCFLVAIRTAFASGVPRIAHFSKLIKKGEE